MRPPRGEFPDKKELAIAEGDIDCFGCPVEAGDGGVDGVARVAPPFAACAPDHFDSGGFVAVPAGAGLGAGAGLLGVELGAAAGPLGGTATDGVDDGGVAGVAEGGVADGGAAGGGVDDGGGAGVAEGGVDDGGVAGEGFADGGAAADVAEVFATAANGAPGAPDAVGGTQIRPPHLVHVV